MEAAIDYYLRLSNRRFAQHPLFALYCYDLLAQRQMWNSAHLQSEFSPSQNDAITKLTSEEVRVAIQYEVDCQAAAKEGKPPPPRPTNITQPAQALLRKVKAAAKSVTGTNEERKKMYQEVCSMRLLYGSPHFYLTVNVKDSTAYALLNYSGHRHKLDLGMHVTEDELKEIAGHDPVACAQFFEATMEMVYGIILGISPSTAGILKRGGLLGHVEHFYAAKETQARGSLHEHIIGWLAGFPKTMAEFEERVKQDGYSQQLDEYLQAMVNSSLPIETTSVPCPNCKHETVTAIKITEAHRSKGVYKSKKVPHLVKCTTDDCKYSGNFILPPSNFLWLISSYLSI